VSYQSNIDVFEDSVIIFSNYTGLSGRILELFLQTYLRLNGKVIQSHNVLES